MVEPGKSTARDLVLTLEAALDPPGAAIVSAGRIVALEAVASGPRHRGDLLAAISRVLRAASASVGEITGLAVGTGPGSFTGTRVALGIVHGLRLARPEWPCIAVESPRILLEAAGLAPSDTAIVAIPWGRLRALLVRESGQASPAARLVALDQLANESSLADASIVTTPALADTPWPAGSRVTVTSVAPIEALARMVAEGRAGWPRQETPRPAYAVPPDAVLPARSAQLAPGLRLETLGPDDLPDVVRLEGSSFSDPWSEGMLLAELAPADDRVAIGVRSAEGVLQGFSLLRLGVDALSVLVVATDPVHRGEGVGRAMVREVLSRARALGYDRVDLEVRVGNAPAIALYASEGFVPLGQRRRYYRDGEDALVMSATLGR